MPAMVIVRAPERTCPMSTPLLLLSLLLGVWSLAQAQEPCFCMRDADDGWLRGCVRRAAPETRQPEVFCKAKADAVPTKVTNLKGWTEVKEGADGCKPCAPLPDPTPGSPRGGEEKRP